MAVVRSVLRSAFSSVRSSCSSRFAAATGGRSGGPELLLCRGIAVLNSSFHVVAGQGSVFPARGVSFDSRSPFVMSIGSKRLFSDDVAHMPEIKDPVILNAFKTLMAVNWDEIPNDALHDVKLALSKSTDDTSGKEVLANVFRAAEAVEEFTGVLTSLKMELDDSVGMSGEDVKPLPSDISQALSTVYQRYIAYLDAFSPEESYLRKKVEVELGTKMIHLKMRCGGLGSEWGKVTVLGTSGLSGSYIEQRT
ncbi:hypothetical protein MLD38_034898 [Melastoma candidum]|uniref:Uncharacterized protein n=1 Tax=Melastoma candidum TaxID=119954 RepID=A0ACB9MF77_9MYRT|nr:hypothetical protein MLD38_034898 [Melastoma candidum]